MGQEEKQLLGARGELSDGGKKKVEKEGSTGVNEGQAKERL